jgi:hypothetical protein
MRKIKKPILVYGNYYHVETAISYLGIAECRLVNGKPRFVQKLNLYNGTHEERECTFVDNWYLATDEDIKSQDTYLI